jgi:hypothetical protein
MPLLPFLIAVYTRARTDGVRTDNRDKLELSVLYETKQIIELRMMAVAEKTTISLSSGLIILYIPFWRRRESSSFFVDFVVNPLIHFFVLDLLPTLL